MTVTTEQSINKNTFATMMIALRENFQQGEMRSLQARQRELQGLAAFLQDCEKEINVALDQDLHKSSFEAFITETGFISGELNYTRKQLAKWMQREKVHTPLMAQPASSFIEVEPRGVVLIISPWNYPVQLTLVPLIGALAAGNCVVIKPSEMAPASSALLAAKLPQYLNPSCVEVVTGGAIQTEKLLQERFDYIFYTGNGKVGRIVMEAAAKYLTPVTLELGGKSPCIVDRDADVKQAARRIVWGKFMNAGQTCIAPDYVLAHADIVDELLMQMKKYIREFYGENAEKSPDYGRIINEKHVERLVNLLQQSGTIYVGGETNVVEKYIAPTLLYPLQEDAPIMQEEIFGPILPVFSVKNMNSAIEFINKRAKPLALYLFTKDEYTEEQVLRKTSSGGVCINHTMMHLSVPQLPFGGVGESGMGVYHGRASFDTFSHRKAVLKRAHWFDPRFLYPPYHHSLKKWLRLIMR